MNLPDTGQMGGSVYIMSDLHFGDTDCKYVDPDWITPEEQLRIIDEVAGKNDCFIYLGDVSEQA